MKVLVTGGAGYIGSVMVAMLRDLDHEVMVLDDLSMGHREAAGGARLAVLDLLNGEEVMRLCRGFRPQACIHFAAKSLVAESVANPRKYFLCNVGGGLNLLEGLHACGCEVLIFSSTCAVYGIPDEFPISETEKTKPVSPYGHSKSMLEKVLFDLSRAGSLRYASLRYFNAAGADMEHDLGEDHHPETHLIPRIIAAALGREPEACIYGTDYPTPDGTCVRDYVHVTDLCRAHMLALDYLLDGGESSVYNLGNGRGFSVREVIDVVRDASGVDFEVQEMGRREGDPPVLVASSSKIIEELGWEPEFTELKDIVESAWVWHSSHPDGYGD